MFKILTTAGALALCAATANAATLYSETFTDQEGQGIFRFGADTSLVDWRVERGNINLTTTKGYFKVKDGAFTAKYLGGKAVWHSPVVDVTGYTDLKLSVDFGQKGDIEANDYVDVSISMNGGVTGYNVLDVNGFGINGVLERHALIGNHNWPSREDFGATTLVEEITEPGSLFALTVKFKNNERGEIFTMDNITLTGTKIGAVAPVPLPASGLLLVGGLAGLVAARRRR
ncbi:MAG: VPLPA-CTERM sorting domain-containing protein [Silicimonas sp.]|nr:VPLPA-CTERM sorting domain-containing protein [Silicimonas sp.]